MSILPKVIVDLVQFLLRFNGIFYRGIKTILKFIWNHKKPQIAKTFLRKKNKVVGISLPDFKLYYRAVVIK